MVIQYNIVIKIQTKKRRKYEDLQNVTHETTIAKIKEMKRARRRTATS